LAANAQLSLIAAMSNARVENDLGALLAYRQFLGFGRPAIRLPTRAGLV